MDIDISIRLTLQNLSIICHYMKKVLLKKITNNKKHGFTPNPCKKEQTPQTKQRELKPIMKKV